MPRQDQSSTGDSHPPGDFYANVDLARTRRMGSALFAFAFVCVAVVLPLSPPDSALGDAGWPIAAGTAIAFVACASRLKRGGDRVTPTEMLAMGYASPIRHRRALDRLAGSVLITGLREQRSALRDAESENASAPRPTR